MYSCVGLCVIVFRIVVIESVVVFLLLCVKCFVYKFMRSRVVNIVKIHKFFRQRAAKFCSVMCGHSSAPNFEVQEVL